MKAKRGWLIAGMVIGAVLMASPFVTALSVAFGMSEASRWLRDSGIANPDGLAANIRTAGISAVVSFALFPLGIAMFVLSLILFLRLRASNPPPLSGSPNAVDN